jgi:competence transcription factor ComK
MSRFIELTIDVQRNPTVQTRTVTVNTACIVQIESRKTIDQDGGATVTLSNAQTLSVVESYASLKKRLQQP